MMTDQQSQKLDLLMAEKGVARWETTRDSLLVECMDDSKAVIDRHGNITWTNDNTHKTRRPEV